MKLTRRLLLALLALSCPPSAVAEQPARRDAAPEAPLLDSLRTERLVAWCIVPFDASKRGPEQRAEMLRQLGLRRCAYDWRQEHVASFEEEILQYKRHGIEMFAFWDQHPEAFRLFEKHGLHPQIWRTAPSPAGGTQGEKVEAAARAMLPLAEQTAELKCPLGLYNHGGWGGQPQNLAAVCRRLRQLGHGHVGIVYNFHHGHAQIDDWAESWKAMQPYLLCLNINGMNAEARPKILGLGQGEFELQMLQAVADSGYDGPIGILDHRPEADSKKVLEENLRGLRWLKAELAAPGSGGPKPAPPESSTGAAGASVAPYDPALVAEIVKQAAAHGDPVRGAAVFASAKFACLSCHKIGARGGEIGPELTRIAAERSPQQLVESLFWPRREVKPEFMHWQLLTADGTRVKGYRIADDEQVVVIRDPATERQVRVARDDVERESPAGTLMPDGLAQAMTPRQQLDVVRLLTSLRPDSPAADDIQMVLKHAHSHAPAEFAFDRRPLAPERWPSWQHEVNRDRIYDFYAKQAEHFRQMPHPPPVLPAFPGLDGGALGHWGNQNEETWADARWNQTKLGSVQCGVFRGAGKTVPRAVCLQLGEQGEVSACFNPDTLTYEAVWSGGFVGFSGVRHGFLGGLQMQGDLQPVPAELLGSKPDQPFEYHGFYRSGRRVVFAYRIGATEYLDAPWAADGGFTRVVAPRDSHPLRRLTEGAGPQWPQQIATPVRRGEGRPYAVDTFELPADNPWNALIFCGGHDFLPDGRSLVCTMQGDVWQMADEGDTARWRRVASGLHHPLGLVVADGKAYVQGRDQITRLHDLNGDGEADFYECFSNAFKTSSAGHDFICGLQRDERGRFYTASGNQGLLRISDDGRRAEVLATGFRNPDGLGLLPDGTVTVPCSEGAWTPASMICAVRPPPASAEGDPSRGDAAPFFGYGGPQAGRPPEFPLVYLPRGLDNSSGGQAVVDSDRWGPLQGQLLHFSFGAGSHFLILRDEVDGQLQGAAVPLPGEFRSGAHRGRFNHLDGQLYVSGMAGWGSYTPDDGCYHRVRYSGDRVQLPVGFHVHRNGLMVKFAEPVDSAAAGDPRSHFAQSWNYRYSGAYGSPELSTRHPGVTGHDTLPVESSHVSADGRRVFLELDVQPCSQLHLRMHVGGGDACDLFATVHKLDDDFRDYPGYRPAPKVVAAHPLLADLELAANRRPNPFAGKIKGARRLTVQTGKNLTYATPLLEARAGEPLELVLVNPDVVPHNWALVRPGALRRVGEMANRLVADPQAYARQYIPRSDDVLAHTDVVGPRSQFTIYFRAPKQPGVYPFLCTFPGHWMVMNGELVVK